MAIVLVEDSDTYELKYPHDDGKGEPVVFTLRYLSTGNQCSIDDQVSEITMQEAAGKDQKAVMKQRHLAGTAARLRIQFAVVGWRGVLGKNGQPSPCTDEN